MIVEETNQLPEDAPNSLEGVVLQEDLVKPEIFDGASAFEELLGGNEEKEEAVDEAVVEEEEVVDTAEVEEEESEKVEEEEEENNEDLEEVVLFVDDEGNNVTALEAETAYNDYHKEIDNLKQVKDSFVEQTALYAQNLAVATSQTVKDLQAYDGVDWSTVSLEDQQYHQKVINGLIEQQTEQKEMFESLSQIANKQAGEHRAEEARISFPILQKAIPDWSQEKDAEIRAYAVGMGVPVEAANALVDAPTLLAFYNSMIFTNGKDAIKNVKKQTNANTQTQQNRGKAVPNKKVAKPSNDFNKKGRYDSSDAISAFERLLK